MRCDSSLHRRVAHAVLSTSAACTAWRQSVNSAKVWRALCLKRWPSTAQLPLPPTADYGRLFKSRAIAQHDPHELTPKDVFFLLELRNGRTHETVFSKALNLGDAREDTRGEGYCWLVPELAGMLFDRRWHAADSAFYRRTDDAFHRVTLYFSQQASFRFPGVGHEEIDVDHDVDSEQEESEDGGESGEFDDFIDDSGAEGMDLIGEEDHIEGGEEGGEEGSEESGEEGSEEGGEEDGEEKGDELSEEDGEECSEGEEDTGDRSNLRPLKHRRVIDDDESDGDGGDDGDDGISKAERLPLRKHRRVISDDAEDDEEDVAGAVGRDKAGVRGEGSTDKAGDGCDWVAENGSSSRRDGAGRNGSSDEISNWSRDSKEHLFDRRTNKLLEDEVPLELVTGIATLEQLDNGFNDANSSCSDQAGTSARCILAFDHAEPRPGSVERVPMVILQFQVRDLRVQRDLGVAEWQPTQEWFGEYGRSVGIWQILDGLAWG